MEENKQHVNEDIYSKVLRAGRRTYFFDVRSTKAGDYYLTISESKKFTNEDGTFYFKKHKIYLYKEDFENLFDINRTVPNVNYLHVQQPGSDLDITFSYATELININEGPAKVPPGAAQPGTDFPGYGDGRNYKGARITLWTNAYQGQ